MTRSFSIGIVAPSGYAADQGAYERGLDRLHALGHRIKDFSAGLARHQRFAASDAERVAQLHAAARDPDVELVMAMRGGYGLSRLLPAIDFSLLASSGKRWIGHSDFTALQMGLLAMNCSDGVAGPMICDDFSCEEPSEFTHDHFWRAMTQKTLSVSVAAPGNPRCRVEGRLWGGNLAMLCHLVGSRWMPEIDGGILFVEDVNEHPYRIERMLLQLAQSGVLDRQQALLLGDFSGYRLTPYDNGYDFDAMLGYLRERLAVPVIYGLPFGHVRDKLTLPVGADCVLDAGDEGFSLRLGGYPLS